MYIQLTDRCNMTCPHCCFAATRKGADMDAYTFIQALDLATDYGQFVTLGGGEPTCHKDFFRFLDKTIEYFERGKLDMPPLVVTNGKLTGKARKLLQYIDEERPVYVDLSQDEYHDSIHPEIVAGFQRHEATKRRSAYGRNSIARGGAGIRTVSQIVPVGRAADAARGILTSSTIQCACEDTLADPHGNVFSCGCRTHLLGNVFESIPFLEDFDTELAHTGGGLPVRESARLPIQLAVAA